MGACRDMSIAEWVQQALGPGTLAGKPVGAIGKKLLADAPWMVGLGGFDAPASIRASQFGHPTCAKPATSALGEACPETVIEQC